MEKENNYLIVDDMLDTTTLPISKEFLKNMPIPQKGKMFSGTLGIFNIKDFERAIRRNI